MPSQKNIRIELRNGMVIRIPKIYVQKIVLPSVEIERRWKRLVLDYKNMEKKLRKFI